MKRGIKREKRGGKRGKGKKMGRTLQRREEKSKLGRKFEKMGTYYIHTILFPTDGRQEERHIYAKVEIKI